MPVGPPRGHRPALPGTAAGIGGKAPAPVAESRVGVHGVVGWRAEHRRELAIELDELLSDCASFSGIGAEEFGRREAAHNGGELPTKVETILHGDGHSLPGFRAMGVTALTADEAGRGDAGGLSVRWCI